MILKHQSGEKRSFVPTLRLAQHSTIGRPVRRFDANCSPIRQEKSMPIDSPAARIDLAAGRPAVLERARGTRVECLDGTLWITQDGDNRDIVLPAGSAFVVDRDTRVLVSAVDMARFALRLASAGGVAVRLPS
jgi:hypothetical protein